MKKLAVMMLAVVMSVSVIACGGSKDNNDTNNNGTNAGTQSGAADNNTGDASENTGAGTVDTDNVFGDVPMADLKTAVTDVLGENYWPQMALDAEMLSATYGITEDMYDDFLAEAPMMSAHIDAMVIIKAKDGQVEAVEEALNAYRDTLTESNLYPSHIAKAQASRIEAFGNYVCFLLLGGDTAAIEEQGEEATIAYCQEENEKAIEAIRLALTE